MLKKIKQMIKEKKDLNQLSDDGEIILHQAVKSSDLEAVQLLLDVGVDINRIDPVGNSALMFSSWNGDQKISQLLIENGAQINSGNNFGYTPLICATLQGKWALVNLLLKSGADSDIENFEGDTPLLIAVKNNDEKTVITLLSNGSDIHHQNKEGLDSLMLAALLGHENLVNLLLENGADVFKSDKEKNTALLLAANYGHIGIVKNLSDAGSDLYWKNKKGLTAVDLATLSNHKEVMDYFFEKMGEKSLAPQYRSVPKRFWHAISCADLDIVKEMISSGVSVNSSDEKGMTPLMLAAFKGHEKVISYLIDLGADLTQKDYNGKTAIDYAVESEQYEMAGLLKKSIEQEQRNPRIFSVIQKGTPEKLKEFIELGFDVNVQDEEGDPPLFKSVLKNDLAKTKILLEHGADIHFKNKKGEGVLHQVEKSNVMPFKMLQMVALLQEFGLSGNLVMPKPARTIYDVICSKTKLTEELKMIKKSAKSLGLKSYRMLKKENENGRN